MSRGIQMSDKSSNNHKMVTDLNSGSKGQNALVIFEGPIKQSSPITELEGVVSYQFESIGECTEIIETQQ